MARIHLYVVAAACAVALALAGDPDVFVFPRGLVHFQQNRGHGPAAVVAAFNSQLQGTQAIAMTLFGATPPVPTDILAKAFRVGSGEVEHIKANFAPK
ncbi:Germin-like protein subfamily 2 member 1 [Zea mays]|uniref:Germin-like protein n=1 Tax=Zea mays TaxID=4577 RepID=A0A1D6FAW8_MAIZE|nr:Germin-like protein subfamily 2 member 1 [Zea mays]